MILLDGKKVKEEVLNEVREENSKLDRKLGLVVIQVGNDPASSVYVRQKEKMAESIGANFRHIKLEDNIRQKHLIGLIESLNYDNEIDGILLQLPIPGRFDIEKVINSIDPEKDVDGLTRVNVEKLENGCDGIVPCTPLGVMEMLKYYNIDIKDKNVCVIGRSALVGKPVAELLRNAGGIVSVCHSKTINMEEITKRADILVVAVGKKGLVTEEMVKDGAVVVDVGINRVDGKLYGDVDFDAVSKKASYITPVPGGVGPMTIAMLSKNLLKAYNLKNSKKKVKCLIKK